MMRHTRRLRWSLSALFLIGGITAHTFTAVHSPSPALAVGSPVAGGVCQIAPRALSVSAIIDQLIAGATPLPASIITLPPQRVEKPSRESAQLHRSDLPEGSGVTTAVRDDVVATITELVACDQAGETERAEALYTDQFFFRQAAVAPNIADVNGPQVSIGRLGIDGAPSVGEVWTISDGRIGAIVHGQAQTLFYVLVFDEPSQRYSIDEEALLIDDATPTA